MANGLLPGIALLLLASCTSLRNASDQKDPLAKILSELKQDPIGAKVLQNTDLYELQILYTQIDRDAAGQPVFHTYAYHVDSNRYFYPASTVKLPTALLALEKIRHLQQNGFPGLNRDTYYRIDSLRAFQQTVVSDPQAPAGKPSVAQDVRRILTSSDNLAYNHLFEFLGREYINNTLASKGYAHTGIVHRFNYPGRDNRYASPIAFYTPAYGIYQEGEKLDTKNWPNPQHGTLKGKGYYDAADSLVNQAFDFGKKNWFALTDMEKMLRAVLFPESVPARNRFDLSPEDRDFVRHYLGIFPRECDYPKYDSSYYDSFAKFLYFGDSKEQQDGSVRSYNKIGEAYGTLTDVAYIADKDRQVECILAATILCNPDGILREDHYTYEEIGRPFLAKLGRAAYALQRKRQKK